MTIYDFINGISSGEFDEQLRAIYGKSERNILRNKARYISVAESFSGLYPEDEEIRVFSVGGALEIGGELTRYHGGKTLAASLDADIISIVALNNTHEIHFASEVGEKFIIDLKNMSKSDNDKSIPLVKQFICNLIEKNTICDGFDIYVSSDKSSYSVISSESAVEVLLEDVIGSLFIADESKNSRLLETDMYSDLEHAVSALGGFVLAEKSEYKKINFDFTGSGYSIFTASSGNTHNKRSDRINSLSDIMNDIAEKISIDNFGEIDKEDFFEKLPELQQKYSNNELMYAALYYEEAEKLEEASEALENGDTETFFDSMNHLRESATVFFKDYADSDYYDIILAASMCRSILVGSGAVNISNGTLIAFAPDYLVGLLNNKVSACFKNLTCRTYNFRYKGICELKKSNITI